MKEEGGKESGAGAGERRPVPPPRSPSSVPRPLQLTLRSQYFPAKVVSLVVFHTDQDHIAPHVPGFEAFGLSPLALGEPTGLCVELLASVSVSVT